MKTVYLDSAILMDMADGKIRALEFEDAASAGRIRPVFSMVHLLDAAKQSELSKSRLTTYIDLLCRKGEAVWVRFLDLLASMEVQEAYLRHVGVRPEEWSPFLPTLIETMPGSETEFLDEMKRDTITYQSEFIFSHASLQDEYFPYRQEEHPTLRLRPLVPIRERVFELVPADPKGEDDRVTVTDDLRREFADTVDVSQFRALHMIHCFNVGWQNQIQGRDESDLEDRAHLAGLAYCDVGFADKRTVSALEKGKSNVIPLRNGQFQEWVGSL